MDIYGMLHPTTEEYTLIYIHGIYMGTVTKTDHLLGHNTY